MMEVLSEDESRLLVESMKPPFRKHSDRPISPGSQQNVLLIHGPGQQYKLTPDHDVPEPNEGEILIKILAIGLNPVDWKGPEYNFGLPSLPWINGRDFAGVVVKAPKTLRRLRVGDVVLSPSTDYRDIRKAAFQEYAISTEHNSARIPEQITPQTGAAIGVAFVAAALALGVSLGVDFSSAQVRGPNLLGLLRVTRPSTFPEDIRHECTEAISLPERASSGDWVTIWGASTTTGLMAIQLAKLAGLRTIGIADMSKHGKRLVDAGVDLLVDRLDTQRAVEIIRGVTNSSLRFGIDAVGRESSTLLQSTLSIAGDQKSHLVGLAGLPKTTVENVVHHSVPIKAFHCFPQVGEALMRWLEDLLIAGNLKGPDIHVAGGGFEGVNSALHSLKDGRMNGKRVVVPVQQPVVASA